MEGTQKSSHFGKIVTVLIKRKKHSAGSSNNNCDSWGKDGSPLQKLPCPSLTQYSTQEHSVPKPNVQVAKVGHTNLSLD